MSQHGKSLLCAVVATQALREGKTVYVASQHGIEKVLEVKDPIIGEIVTAQPLLKNENEQAEREIEND